MSALIKKHWNYLGECTDYLILDLSYLPNFAHGAILTDHGYRALDSDGTIILMVKRDWNV